MLFQILLISFCLCQQGISEMMIAMKLEKGIDEMEFIEAESDMSEDSIFFPHFIFNFIIIGII